jgi:diguanylate cyclase (GGDEF)-like protein/PAS domain S-box-containing protein
MVYPEVVDQMLSAASPYVLLAAVVECAVLLFFVLLWRSRRDKRADAVQARLAETQRQAAILAEQAALLDLAHDGILVWGLKTGAVRFWNRGSEELYGWTRDDALGRTPQELLQTRFPQPLHEINEQLVRTRRWEGELVHTRRDGTQVVVASRWALQVDAFGEPLAVLGINTDVTERKRAVAALEHQAMHDGLTGLPNRSLFTDRLEHALAQADRRDQRVAVLFLDLDNFKVINDSLGHQAGDTLLIEVARRLQACLRAGDTVARLGGDEFTLLLEQGVHAEAADRVADRIADALRAPIHVEQRDVFISASIGIALSTPRRTAAGSLLDNADTAMYQAKAAGKAQHAVFEAGMSRRAVERLELETDLRQAIELNQLRVYYQPIYALEDNQVVEVEALVRWERPGHGLISPAVFIPIAEDSTLIVEIGQWVLEEACRQVCEWHARFPERPHVTMSVNLSARHFQHPDLIADIERAVHGPGLDPRYLNLEVTESVAMQDAESTVTRLHALKALGIKLAIDDFGTGYSSLGYLKSFPVDGLKIDRSLVDGIGQDAPVTAIVQSVLDLARTLGLTVTGEGIETQAQAAHLKAFGCDRGQGFLFARPLAADGIPALLAQGTGGIALLAA